MNQRDLEMKNTVQSALMLGSDNLWFTGERVGHSPNRQEACLHFVITGGAKDFHEWWMSLDLEDKIAAYHRTVEKLKEETLVAV
ncbi:MAG: hypothetical protein UV64_C0018G0009 [Parcubacteria group bacterium GW2011_GWC1_43_11b]|uniref:Uncharacterized protein n=2 Tax=Candidatus Vogeliibacteriota TaxID=1817922 RepID=A0A1G2QDR5_9BACT|nr:MAG: hypothetical protein UV50_C0010G0005 [Parcubacteria group bacterium GW2011_GWB1_42_9]KKS88740.1 MAG: hypothetical protein UV64_C0018G0009 [Parcubacteria group bacterium GW2011_GWC1_43_11b]KKT09364.1 MAG: hypothetical protein UV88_C0011G0008 [Parcubacteria group bacterium GW2011_GWA1_43_21]OHA58740.1 MAG: hypothetical protein A2370_02085 [Candidatus Vogelbacteria bacterium RIFOXYB1_FULL_42_16]OHA59229.1 MAG: hypothetical protein A2607_01105 [Candidatus Vogelbacteria bacterium RIFOXYD1_FU